MTSTIVPGTENVHDGGDIAGDTPTTVTVPASQLRYGNFVVQNRWHPGEVRCVDPELDNQIIVHFADGDRERYGADEQVEILAPAEAKQYRDQRDRRQRIAGLRELADFLEENPDLPLLRDITVRHSIGVGDGVDSTDAAGLVEVRRLAERLGVEVTGNDGAEPTESTTHFDAIRRFSGGVEYEAGYILRDAMARWNAIQAAGEAAVDGTA